MVTPNVQAVVAGKRLVVQSAAGSRKVAISVDASGPSQLSIEPLLVAGLDEREAMNFVMEIVKIAVGGAAR